MTQAWWPPRQWKFVADMNRDGAITLSDVRLWAEWALYLPGDALIAQLGPTTSGSMFNLTPKSFGGGTSAVLSVALWLFGIWALYRIVLFLIDAADPTFLAERRERREAQARARRAREEYERRIRSGRLRRALRWLVFGLVVLLLAALAVAILKDVL